MFENLEIGNEAGLRYYLVVEVLSKLFTKGDIVANSIGEDYWLLFNVG